MRVFASLLILMFMIPLGTLGQSGKTNRSTMYFTYGNTGANIREFNQMLNQKGLTPMRNGYSNLGFGYQTRFNDFVLGMELFQNGGARSHFNNYDLDYRTTRVYLNVGYSFTEEGKFQLIHYMSIGSGFMNFQMLRDSNHGRIREFLQDPAHGYILRDGNIHKGSRFFTGFLTEIGFQLGYDLEIPGRDEVFELIAKFGYSFSPFEDSWHLKNIAFGNIQSGAFFRVGAGISLPDHNFFYKDASLGIHLLYGIHFTKPNQLNKILAESGLEPFSGHPNNWGLKVLGESKGILYGMDFYNLGMSGNATDSHNHTLNSIRVYANGGLKFYERRNLELGGMGGIGYGNIRYSLLSKYKPDFPRLFEEPDHDGYLKNGGMMGKPELYIAYGIPLTRNNLFNLIFAVHGGYEVPFSRYRLADLSMYRYMSNPYFQFSVGLRP